MKCAYFSLPLVISVLALAACTPHPSDGLTTTSLHTGITPISTSTGTSTSTSTAIGLNSLALKVSDATLCNASGYVNEPCVSITICIPGSTTSCVTINNILVDTGSAGLRIFSTLDTLGLTAVSAPDGGTLAECAQFGSGNAWGKMVTADIVLGSETAGLVPIQLINSGYATVPASCTSPFSSAAIAGFNGILGVGLDVQDCGATCASTATSVYYSCTGAACHQSTAPLGSQATNPVSALTQDNNGVTVVLPSVGNSGLATTSGSLYLGVGTQTNNTPASSVTTYFADDFNSFTAVYNGTSYNSSNLQLGSFLDTGSNYYNFPTAITTECGSTTSYSGYYCPSSVTAFSAVIKSAVGSNQGTISFNLGNAATLLTSGNLVFSNVGLQWTEAFDLGLPFFFGRTVYVVIDGKSSSLGTGPLWGF